MRENVLPRAVAPESAPFQCIERSAPLFVISAVAVQSTFARFTRRSLPTRLSVSFPGAVAYVATMVPVILKMPLGPAQPLKV